MKKILGIIACLCLFQANAQINITSSDMPEEGETYIFSSASLFGAYDLTGEADHSWDYSILESTGYDSLDVVSVSGAPFAYQFLFNNPFIPEYLADFATTTPDIDLGGFFTVSDSYSFYQNNPDDYRILGSGITVNGIPGVGTTEPIDIVYNFPMNYGDMDTSASVLDLQIIGIGNYHVDQIRMNEVDGWGTVTIPLGEYDCLRVKTEIIATDSIYADLLGFGFSFPRPETFEYKWLSTNQGIPVLKIVETAGVISEVSYMDTIVPPEVDNVLGFNSLELNIFPNPTVNEIVIESVMDPIQSVLIYNEQGQIVGQENNINTETLRYDTSNLTSGNYIVKIHTKYRQITKVITKL